MEAPMTVSSIMLADDDSDDRYFFEKALSAIPNPPSLVMVSDGEKLIAHLMGHLEQLPDLIFLDLNMPRKNGLESLAEIKASDLLKHIPVVMYSTSLRDETATELYNHGAHYYMHKCEYRLLSKNIMLVMQLIAHNPLQPEKNKFTIGTKNSVF